MPSTVILGAQWGDEGKGKIVDYYSDRFDLVVRYQGGNNAGHTVVTGGKKFKIQLIPSGIIRVKRSLIASGVVVDPEVLSTEISLFRNNGINVGPDCLGVDFRAHVIMPWHRLLDAAREKGRHKIGTTGRGIGPVYESKAWRWGLRFEDLIEKSQLKAELEKAFPVYERILSEVYGVRDIPKENEILEKYGRLGAELKAYSTDVSVEVSEALSAGKNVLFEGAQGILLDNNFGTYPFVTSSQPVAANAAASTGIAPNSISAVEAVVKAYATRVGEGPFPTEISGKLADSIREKGGEYGTVTGRPRRVGWLDLTALRFGNRLNGYACIHLTKLDVLAGIGPLKVCTAHTFKGKTIRDFPARKPELFGSVPEYVELSGFDEPDWGDVVEKGKKAGFSALPQTAEAYVRFIEYSTGINVQTVSVGPAREQIIIRSGKKA